MSGWGNQMLRLALAAGGCALACWFVAGSRVRRKSRPVAAGAVAAARRVAAARTRRVVAWRAPAVIGLVVLVPLMSPGVAIAAALTWWAISGLMIASGAAKRTTQLTDSLAGFATLLANQAQTAPTVIAAISEATELASGAVTVQARALGDGLADPGLDAAAEEFASAVPHPLAGQIADTLVLAKDRGFAWARSVDTLAELANETAVTTRLLRQKVVGQFTGLAATVMLGAGILGGMAVLVPNTGPWYNSVSGQTTLVAVASLFAILCGRLSGRANRELRR